MQYKELKIDNSDIRAAYVYARKGFIAVKTVENNFSRNTYNNNGDCIAHVTPYFYNRFKSIDRRVL